MDLQQDQTAKVTIESLLANFVATGNQNSLEKADSRIASASNPEINSALNYISKLSDDDKRALSEIKERLEESLT